MFSTETGLVPFMSVVRDPTTYDKFEHFILLHSVRRVDELAYHDFLIEHLPAYEFLGDMVLSQMQ